MSGTHPLCPLNNCRRQNFVLTAHNSPQSVLYNNDATCGRRGCNVTCTVEGCKHDVCYHVCQRNDCKEIQEWSGANVIVCRDAKYYTVMTPLDASHHTRTILKSGNGDYNGLWYSSPDGRGWNNAYAAIVDIGTDKNVLTRKVKDVVNNNDINFDRRNCNNGQGGLQVLQTNQYERNARRPNFCLYR